MKTTHKPVMQLVGEDGNAFAVLGRAQRAAKEAGWSKEKIKSVMDEATSGDYNHLLATIMENFDCDTDGGTDYDDDDD